MPPHPERGRVETHDHQRREFGRPAAVGCGALRQPPVRFGHGRHGCRGEGGGRRDCRRNPPDFPQHCSGARCRWRNLERRAQGQRNPYPTRRISPRSTPPIARSSRPIRRPASRWWRGSRSMPASRSMSWPACRKIKRPLPAGHAHMAADRRLVVPPVDDEVVALAACARSPRRMAASSRSSLVRGR